MKRLRACLSMLFAQAFCFLEKKKKKKKKKERKNINKQLKIQNTQSYFHLFMLDQNTFSTKKQKAPSKKFCQTNPTFLHKFP
jgi:hypothetical protein